MAHQRASSASGTSTTSPSGVLCVANRTRTVRRAAAPSQGRLEVPGPPPKKKAAPVRASAGTRGDRSSRIARIEATLPFAPDRVWGGITIALHRHNRTHNHVRETRQYLRPGTGFVFCDTSNLTGG